MRPQPQDDPSLPLLFWWKGPDGSRVLAQRIPIQYSQSYAATPEDIEAVVRSAETECFAPDFRHGVMWFGVGNHGGGPTRAHIAKILKLSNDKELPELHFSTLRDYFAAAEKDPAFAALPEVDRELNFLFRGCYSSTGAVKRLNRAGEKALFRAESLMLQSGGADASELGDEIGRPESLGLEVLEDGPVVRITRETFRWEKSEIWLDTIRHSHTSAVELRLRINWQEKRQMLKLEIPTRLKKVAVRAKMPGEIATRTPEGREEPCHDWVALEGTLGRTKACVAVINDSTYAYDVLEGILRLTLIRAVPAAEHPPFEYKDDRYVRFLDQGWQERRFWIVAGEGDRRDLQVDRLAEECQQPPVSMRDSGHPGTEPWESSFLSMETPGIQVLACKPAENGKGMILRLQEIHGEAVRATGRWQGKTFSLRLRPWEIRSLRLHIVRDKLKATPVDALEQPVANAHPNRI
jgi:alpha-mannosidase